MNGDGPTCSQSGTGPKDMMMSPGKMNPKYMWHKEGGQVTIPIVLDHEYSELNVVLQQQQKMIVNY